MAKHSNIDNDNDHNSRHREDSTARRSPPPLPSAAKKKAKANQRKPPVYNPAPVMQMLAIGGGAALILTLIAVAVYSPLLSTLKTLVTTGSASPEQTDHEALRDLLPERKSSDIEGAPDKPRLEKVVPEVRLSDALEPLKRNPRFDHKKTFFVEDETNTLLESTPSEASSDLAIVENEPRTSTLEPELGSKPADNKSTGDTTSAEEKSIEESMPPTDRDAEITDFATSSSTEETSASLDSMIQLAIQLIKTQKGKQAIITLRKASLKFPSEIRPDFYLGLVFSGVGLNEPKNAELHFKKVLERSPGHVPTLNNLALTEMKATKFAASRNYFSQAAKSNPRPMEVNHNLGRMLVQAPLLEIQKEEVKNFTKLRFDPRSFNEHKGWFYMPIGETQQLLAESKQFCIKGQLEDRSCSCCSGKGRRSCARCTGTGKVLQTGLARQTVDTVLGRETMSGAASIQVACPECGGKRHIDCDHCSNGEDPQLR